MTHSGEWLTAEEVAMMELARANPQGGNGYAYVLGNPATLADNLGLAAPPCGWGCSVEAGSEVVAGAAAAVFVGGAIAEGTVVAAPAGVAMQAAGGLGMAVGVMGMAVAGN